MISRRPRVASFFSGIGGLDLGFQWAGFDVVWATDVMAAAADSYALNFGKTLTLADVNDISFDAIPSVDVVIGGPPCQSFSLVGRRQINDERGKLVFKFVDAVSALSPNAFVMENVSGISSSRVDGGGLPEILVSSFHELGFRVSVMQLDASQYLVPQRRKRVFIVGIRDGCRIAIPSPVEFAAEVYGIDVTHFANGAYAAIGDLGEPVGRGQLAEYRDAPVSEFAAIMRRLAPSQLSHHELPSMSNKDRELLAHIPPGGNYRDVPDSVATKRILRFKQTGGRTTTYARLHPDRPSYTVNTQFRRPNVGSNFHYEHQRLITAREAMRFQSIPDRFSVINATQEQRNCLIGNAVPPLLGQAVAWAVLRAMRGVNGGSVQQTRLF
jgi:DNA (cytosine-5)-methyltransferase 1